MPVPTDITAGTITITNGSTAVTGVGTSWLASDLRQGDIILWIDGGDGFQTPIIQTVNSNTSITLANSWTGPTLTGVAYRIRYQWDSSRVSAQSRQLIELLDNGNVLALSGLTGPGVPVFNGPHSMTVKPETEFVQGVNFDVQVNTLADRATYDAQAAGFAVLVSDIGDGRSAVYSKLSNASGDWSAAAYITGPASTVPGVTWRGTYSAAITYAINDGVTFNGSSFRKLTTAAAGTAPSSTIPPVNTTDWEVLAAKGETGSISGVTTFWQNRITVDTNGDQARAGLGALNSTAIVNENWNALPYDGIFTNLTNGTGTPIASDGLICIQLTRPDGSKSQMAFRLNPSFPQTWRRASNASGVFGGWVELVGAQKSVTNAILADVTSGSIKGRTTAGIGSPEDLTAAQVWGILGVAPVANAYSRNNILGTVSQSLGVPTGALIEKGSNTNGQYARFADGTQICWNDNIAITATTATTALVSWSFPSVFSSANYTVSPPVLTSVGSFTGAKRTGLPYRSTASASSCEIGFLSNALWTIGDSSTATVTAIGRWF